ncbi:MAG: aspartyl/asparaginyl beta-hydroxylase domain-containing protein [Verrucomicrobiota bacterium]|jgi:aspartyl/asparaginyl beta-hydroxylase (cupin superfamily)
MHQSKVTDIDLDDPRSSRQYRLLPPRHLGVTIGRKTGDFVENFIAKRGAVEDLAVFENATFPWAKKVEQEWKIIRKELDTILAFRDQIPSFHEILKEAKTITQDNDWKTFFLVAPGMKCDANQAKCPETTRILQHIPGLHTAFFSILSPHKHIPAHRGPFCGVLRYHLGLLVPEPREQCRIRIGTQIRHWEEGQSLIFDDTYNHEVWNNTDGYRVVLFVDFARPMKSPYQTLLGWLLKAAANTPLLKEAGYKQKKWESKFYGKNDQTEMIQ